jgi:hypothetical protein
MADGIRCHAHPCREPGQFLGTFQAPFCRDCYAALTPLKQREVEEIRFFSVLHPDSRRRALVIINECRRYLATKQKGAA